MSDIDIPVDEPTEEPITAPEAEPAPEPEAVPETAETPTEVPQTGRWLVLTRVRYEAGADEFFAGPGEVIDDTAAAQVDPASIEPAD